MKHMKIEMKMLGGQIVKKKIGYNFIFLKHPNVLDWDDLENLCTVENHYLEKTLKSQRIYSFLKKTPLAS